MTRPVSPRRRLPATGLPLGAVHPDPKGFLGRLQSRNAYATLPHILRQLELSGVLENLRNSNDPARTHVGFNFSDSDLHKTLEAMAWEIARTGTDAFDGFLDEAIALLRSAQHPDGYLNSWAGTSGAAAPWADLTWGHELYCGGHLLQAAVALNRAGRAGLMDVATAWADLVVARFAESGYCGHPEVETALVEFYRETGREEYLHLAQAMIDRRGHGQLPPVHFEAPYFQDHLPPREAREAVGHAVRQLYLDAGVADVAAETGDSGLLPALLSRWESAHHTKMHLTGAMGSRHFDESFGDPYELPPDRAYAETCAAIADFQLSWRLLLLTGEARYADAMERVLLNALPAAVGADGQSFFYSCPLQLRSTHHGEPNAPSHRVAWYPCACCPPNLARLFASLGAYLVSVADDTLTIQQLGDFTVDIPEGVGQGVLSLQYQRGRLTLSLDGSLTKGAVRVRVPAWARREDEWLLVPLDNDSVGIVEFDVSPRFAVAHPHADALRGSVAVTAAGTVYCAESADTPSLEDVEVDPGAGIRDEGGRLMVRGRRRSGAALYRDLREPLDTGGEVDVVLIPYRDWGNRGPGAMRVWLPAS